MPYTAISIDLYLVLTDIIGTASPLDIDFNRPNDHLYCFGSNFSSFLPDVRHIRLHQRHHSGPKRSAA